MPIWAYCPSPFALYAVAVQCQLMCATSGRWENVGEERMSSILLKFFRVNPDIGSCGRWDFSYMSFLDVQVGQLPIRVPKSCSWIFCTFCFGTPTLWRLYPSLKKHKVYPHKPMIFCMSMPSSWFMLWDLWYSDLLECMAQIDRCSRFKPCFAELLATLNAVFMV